MSTAQTLEVPGYQVLQYLGSGARSTIWQIRDRQTGQLFALKRVVRRSAADDRFLEQAINEYQVASQLEHAVVRRVFLMRKVKRWLSVREIHLIMEHCDGHTIHERRPNSLIRTVSIFGKVAGALAFINSRGFVHADMKPNNIIVADNGDVKIIDMGQSCTIGTVKERIQGTPDFIAPEQVQRRPLDARTDVFNFGASLYWAAVGRPIPTELPKKPGVMLKVDMVVQPPEQFNREVPPAMSKLIMDCVETQPNKRPGSMSEVASRLALIAHTLARNGGKAGEDKT